MVNLALTLISLQPIAGYCQSDFRSLRCAVTAALEAYEPRTPHAKARLTAPLRGALCHSSCLLAQGPPASWRLRCARSLAIPRMRPAALRRARMSRNRKEQRQ